MANRSAQPRRTARRQRDAEAVVEAVLPWKHFVITAVLLLAVIAAFWPVCKADFTSWDDYENVARNAHFNPATFEGVLFFWAHPFMGLYIPLTYTVWGILAALGRLDAPDAAGLQLNPAFFHSANLLVHALATIIVYQLLFRLVKKPWPAAAGALLFALHPVQVEAVAWVAGMKDVLCGALSMAALWQYVRYAETESADKASSAAPRRRWIHYGSATAAFLLAMLAKPSAMTLPASAVLIDRFILRRPWRRVALAAGPWFALAVPFMVVARIVQTVTSAPDGGRVWLRPLLATDALAFYLYKLALPIWLAVQYDHSPVVALASRWVFWTWLLPVALAAVVLVNRKRFPWAVAAVGLLVTGTLPVLGLTPFEFERLSLVADHYLYVAMLGPALALAFALAMAPSGSQAARIACIAWLAVLGARAWFQTWHWQTSQTLFEHELAVNPRSATAYNSLAALALQARPPDVGRALRDSEQGIALDPELPEGYVQHGSALAMMGQRAAALADFGRAHQLNPSSPIILSNMAGLLAQEGRLPEAIQTVRQAIALEPANGQAHMNLAIMLVQQKQYPEALSEMGQAAQLAPGDPQVRANYAMFLTAAGQRDAAVREYRAALQIDPNNAAARQGLIQLTGSPQ